MKSIEVKLSGGTSWETENRKEGSQGQGRDHEDILSTHCTPYEIPLLIQCCGNPYSDV